MPQISRKPPNLLYGVNDSPPRLSLVILGIEHGALLISSLMATVFFAQALDLDTPGTTSLINIALIAGGLACILQSLGRWGVGSGYFCLHTSSFIYFQASITAAHVGGLPLVFGMTAFAGIMQAILSRMIGRLRVLFPPEVAGLVVAMVGMALAPYAVRSLFGLGMGNVSLELDTFLVGVGTLVIIVGLNVWGSKVFRLYSILIGIIYGYASALLLGVMPREVQVEAWAMSFFSLPHIEHPGFSFDPLLILPFLIAAICASLKLTGDIITCQKINDLEWKRVDMASVQRGINAEGLGTMTAGLLGGTGLAASSSNIGMSYATGATSRGIGFVTGAFFIGLAFFPQAAFILANMPVPVIGAIIMYAACFMIVTGWSIIMSRMMDSRKTFVVGISLILGVSVLVAPEIFDSIPNQFKPIFGSSIALTAVSGVLLTLLFRIGITDRAVLVLSLHKGAGSTIHDFFEDMGGKWGARQEVVRKAAGACAELHESVCGTSSAAGEMRLEVSFDEYVLKVCAEYEGPELIATHHRPSPEELLEDDQALARMSGYLVMQYADKVQLENVANRRTVRLSFLH
ncbi:solute carrier family 23 protein [Desulfonatronum parangueonense]